MAFCQGSFVRYLESFVRLLEYLVCLPSGKRTGCHFSPPKSDEMEPLIFGSTRSLFPTSHGDESVTFRDRKVTKRSRSFSPTQSVSAKAAEAMSPQRQLYFCVIFSATNSCSSIVRHSAVKTAQCGSTNCREQVQPRHGMLDYACVHRRSFRLTELTVSTHPNVRGKPPTAKERHQRRAIAENRMTAIIKF